MHLLARFLLAAVAIAIAAQQTDNAAPPISNVEVIAPPAPKTAGAAGPIAFAAASAPEVLARLAGAADVAARLRPAVERLTSDACRREARATLDALSRHRPWAVRMLDASARTLPPGLLAGTTAELGNFDECLEVATTAGAAPEDIVAPLQTQFCLARVFIPHRNESALMAGVDMDRGFTRDYTLLGLCIPAACEPEDIQQFLSHLFSERNVSAEDVKIRVDEDACQTRETDNMDWLDIIFICLLSFLLLLILVGTIYDVSINKRKINKEENHNTGMLHHIIMSFSLPNNLTRLFTYEPSADGFDCIFGIKTINMIAIIASHSVLYALAGPTSNGDFFPSLAQHPFTSILNANSLYVDTFLFTGALLTAYHVLSQFSKKASINPLQGILLRYIRLTPAYLVVLLGHATALRWVSSGPLWTAHGGRETERCRASAWANLLYINNYVATDRLCMFQSWYLAADTQLFALSLVLLVVVGRQWALRQTLLWCLVAASAATCYADAILTGRDPAVILRPKDVEDLPTSDDFVHSYIKTHLRSTSYFCGLLLGDWLHHFQETGRTFPKRALPLCWVLSSAAGLVAVFSLTVFYWPFYTYSRLDMALFASGARVAWCAFLGWVIFACATGNADRLHKALSWRPLVPLGRLSYCIYLLNGFIGLVVMSNRRTSVQVDFFTLLRMGIADGLLTYVGALILCLVIDSPMQALLSLLIGKGRRPKAEESAKKT